MVPAHGIYDGDIGLACISALSDLTVKAFLNVVHVSLFQLPDQFPEPGLNLRSVNTLVSHFLRQAEQVLPV